MGEIDKYSFMLLHSLHIKSDLSKFALFNW